MDNIDIKKLISLVEKHECIWKNSTINAENLSEVDLAWKSIAFEIYDNFCNIKENQRRFWVNNLKRKWKLILNKLKTLGSKYEEFKLLQFLTKTEEVNVLKKLNTELGDNVDTENVQIEIDTNDSENLIEHNESNKCGEIFFQNGCYWYKCSICNLTFNTLNSLETHFTKTHYLPVFLEIKVEKIDDIPNDENVEYLIEDMFPEGHIKQKEWSRESENKKILITDVVETFNKNHLEEEANEYNANQTDFIEELGYRDENHEEISYDEMDRIECPHCLIIFQSSSGHDFERCSQIQEKIYKRNGNLRALRDEGIFHCDRCKRYFDSADQMHKHRREEHYEICPACKIRLLNVQNHVNSHHKEIECEKLKVPDSFITGHFECKFCDKVITNKDMWMRHKNKCTSTKDIEIKKKKIDSSDDENLALFL